MATLKRIIGTGFFVLLLVFSEIKAKPLPQGKVTQSGEPSHFQVDDKAAEIEVNANPAGVKVNAKPASLQVVAKPGAPAIPVYHPAIHVAPHYVPPPIIHREPAMFFHHHRHCFPYCLGMSRGWFYAGLRRNKLPKPNNRKVSDSTRRSKLSKKVIQLPRRNYIPDTEDQDEDGNPIIRRHKSSIPRPNKHLHKEGNSRKRQFIAGLPQMYQPLGLGGLGATGYGVQPYSPMTATRAPLARNLVTSLGEAPSSNVLGSLGIYGSNGLNSLAGYGQPLSNNVLGALDSLTSQASSSRLGMYGAMGTNGQQSPSYGLAGRQTNAINKFIQEELKHELYGSAATPSALGLGQGYSRSIITTPYAQSSSGLESLMSGRGGINGAGGLYGSLLGSSGLGYGAGLNGYRNSALMQLAQMYAAQLSGMQSIMPGLQQYGQARSALPWLPYPYLAAGGRSPLVSRSKVPGAKNIQRQRKNSAIAENSDGEDSRKKQVDTQEHEKKEDDLRKKKIRRKRQLLFQPDDSEGYGLSDILQNALVNEFKREMILGTPQPEMQQLASLGDQTQPLPGLQPVFNQAQQQTEMPMLSQLPLNALSADYVSPFDNYDRQNVVPSSRVPLNSLALGRSQLPSDQLRAIPTIPQRVPMMSPGMPMRGYQGPQGLDPNSPIEYLGSPMSFRADYRSPIQYEQIPSRRRKHGRHPLYRRRLHHPRYDDVYDDYDDENDFDEDREMYHPEHLGKERVSFGGSYSEDEIPSERGETLVDTENHGFGPITVEAKTAEGIRKSLGEDVRSDIAKPDKEEETSEAKTDEGIRKSLGEDVRSDIAKPDKEEETSEAKTAEGIRKSLGEDVRSDIAKPDKAEETSEAKTDEGVTKPLREDIRSDVPKPEKAEETSGSRSLIEHQHGHLKEGTL